MKKMICKKFKSTALKRVALLSMFFILAISTVSAQIDCSGIPDWDPAKEYTVAGIRVKYNQKVYENQWWTKGENPETSGQWGVWRYKGDCSTVTPVLTSISISPTSGSVQNGKTLQFTASGKDQSGNPFTITPTWSASGGGTISSSGLFTATTVGGPYIVTAAVGSIKGTASVTVTSGSDTQAPSAPTNLSSSNVTQTGVSLSWTAATDNVGVTGYDVFRGSTNIGNTTSTSYNVTGLTANTSYTFTVKAKDSAGNVSAASNAVTVKTTSGSDTQAPSTPTNLSSSNVTQTGVTLSWTAATDNVGVTGYDVFRGSTNIGNTTSTSYNLKSVSS